MAESAIEWTEQTWNPIVGCSVVSPGCTNCYAMKMAARLERMGQDRYLGLTQPSKAGPVWTGEMRIVEEALTLPLRRRKPTTWFVNSMSDLFHEGVPDEWIDRVFAVMALCPQHTFQVLTKRPARMREWFEERWQPTPTQRIECPGLPAFDIPAQAEGDDRHERVYQAAGEFLDLDTDSDRFWSPDGSRKWPGWPLPNVWLGVSAEDQRRADERVPDLLATPAAVRFVSAEPLLGPIDFTRIEAAKETDTEGRTTVHPKRINSLTGRAGHYPSPTIFHVDSHGVGARLDWIIVGGESGPGARPMHPDWARQIRDACAAAGVAFHFKQWGAWKPAEDWYEKHPVSLVLRQFRNGIWQETRHDDDSEYVCLIGKKAAGRLLDSVEHNGFPEVARG
ncbi:DUF5131 family protein [Methylobacterium fujisawaense]